MTYNVLRVGPGNERLSYEKPTLSEAGYLASKMADQGAAGVRITDENDAEIEVDEAVAEFMRNPPLGWKTM